jgi:hypothetical protein
MNARSRVVSAANDRNRGERGGAGAGPKPMIRTYARQETSGSRQVGLTDGERVPALRPASSPDPPPTCR